ncbi:hypothetical protein [Capnocytophaga felis]|uniref:Uncharacterized protein n=1 Tax=Capnocytophaga felis TaxID=2267611 RepID=A0A5M4BAX3_9FLAO|nr:hypothetical protein [Capnocytophaga felis]GET46462.1 hypothetical protein RCZ01_17640 [Capnocytophaga felis]GET48352.1 hypothetical protein RCZ02_11830 [Capnocytophaga felis]
MKEFIQSLFRTTEERVKNPIIGAFLTSWIIFNWKPILFIIFSPKIIEEKIEYIQSNFSSICFLFVYPIFSTIFYVLALPYLNLLVDVLLKYPLIKRNSILINKQKQSIENQRELAIEEIKLEEAKTDFRERNNHNKMVETLQSKIRELETNLDKEKERYEELLSKLREELEKQKEIASTEMKNFEQQYSNSRKQIAELNELLFEKDKIIQVFKLNYSTGENANIIRLPNGEIIIELREDNYTHYYNLETGSKYNEGDFERYYRMISGHYDSPQRDFP